MAVRQEDFTAPPLRLRLFGSFEALWREEPLPQLRARKGHWLLALLALRQGRAVDRAWLAGTLWPDSPAALAFRSLRSSLACLRQNLGPAGICLQSPTPHTLCLDLANAEADVLAFDAAMARGDPASLEEAVALYRGPLLEECAEVWVLSERQPREQAYLHSLETLAAHALRSGAAAEAERHLRRAIAADPVRESAHRGLMQLLAAGGNYPAALLAYRELRLLLHRELNAEPDAETKDLFERIRAEAQAKAQQGAGARDEGSSATRGATGVERGKSTRSPDDGEIEQPSRSRPPRSPLSPRPRVQRAPTAVASARPPRARTPPPLSRSRSSLRLLPRGSDLSAALSPMAALSRPQSLPLSLTRFVGREQELAQLSRLLEEYRLLTLTGAGGCGKTRLALEVARGRVSAFPDGTRFVDLAPLADPALVPHAVAAVLRVEETRARPLMASLVTALERRELLLVLDNCEHLLEACAHLAQTLLQSCERLRILATSREALALPGERRYRVPSLSVPDASRFTPLEALAKYEAVRLFVDRAAALRPSFTLNEENAGPVGQICRRLEGIPLAIELAAARIAALSPSEIAARLDNRFRLLNGGLSRTALRRHQTLRACIEWSHELLSEPERVLLRRLSVFAGGWTLAAAEAVCGEGKSSPVASSSLLCDNESQALPLPPTNDEQRTTRSEVFPVLDLLIALVEKSLVHASVEEGGTRYGMLEIVRQYGQERLRESGEEATVHDRHLEFFGHFAKEMEPGLRGDEPQAWLEPCHREHDNLRTALAWAVSAPPEGNPRGCTEAGLRLAGSLCRYWIMGSHFREGRLWLEAALQRSEQAAPHLRAKALFGIATMAYQQGDPEAARSYYEQSVPALREAKEWAWVWESLVHLLDLARGRGDHAALDRLRGEVVTAARELARAQGEVRTVDDLTRRIDALEGDAAAAHSLVEETLARTRGIQEAWAASLHLYCRIWLAHGRGHRTALPPLRQEAPALRRRWGDRGDIAGCLLGMARLAWQMGDLETARTVGEEGLAATRVLGDKPSIRHTLDWIGRYAWALGDLDAARECYEEFLELVREEGNRGNVRDALYNLGRIALQKGNLAAAETALREMLRIIQETGKPVLIREALEAMARLALLQHRPERAAHLFGALQSEREVAGITAQPGERTSSIESISTLRAALGEAAFAAVWAEGRAMSPEQAIACALDQSTSP